MAASSSRWRISWWNCEIRTALERLRFLLAASAAAEDDEAAAEEAEEEEEAADAFAAVAAEGAAGMAAAGVMRCMAAAKDRVGFLRFDISALLREGDVETSCKQERTERIVMSVLQARAALLCAALRSHEASARQGGGRCGDDAAGRFYARSTLSVRATLFDPHLRVRSESRLHLRVCWCALGKRGRREESESRRSSSRRKVRGEREREEGGRRERERERACD